MNNGLGFVGKIPSNGDFISRGLDPLTQDQWVGWCQQALSQSKIDLREEWMNTFLTSPLWKFSVGPNVCGKQPFIGLMIPSVDRAGRYFPFLMLQTTKNIAQPYDKSVKKWFARSEELILSTLSENFDFDVFCGQVQEEIPPLHENRLDRPIQKLKNVSGLHLSAGNASEDIQCHWLIHTLFCYSKWDSFWWTDGSDYVEPCSFLTSGLPKPEVYQSLLTGKFDVNFCDSYQICMGEV